jgi:hypothetical protein
MSLQRNVSHVFGVALVLGFCVFAAPSHAQTSPFQPLAGYWAGTGTITLANGARERIRCRVSYAVKTDGKAMQQDLRCASDSYRFDVSTDIQLSGNYLTGMWSESSRGVGGRVLGSVSGAQIDALIESSGFSADLSLMTSGNRQVVSLRPRGIDVNDISVTLSRSK